MVELIPELDEIEIEFRSFRNSATVAPSQGLQPTPTHSFDSSFQRNNAKLPAQQINKFSGKIEH